MKTVSAVEARKGLGRLLNLVSLKGESFVIERAGEKLAVLTPYEDGAIRAKPAEGRIRLLDLAGVGSDIWTDAGVDDFIQKERTEWN